MMNRSKPGVIGRLCAIGMFFVLPIASAESIDITMFTTPGCPHCTDAKSFFADLLGTLDPSTKRTIDLNSMDIADNTPLLDELYNSYGVPANQRGLVPAIFLPDKFYIGYNETIGQEIKDYILGQNILSGKNTLLTLPLVGEVDLLSYSLPVLAITLGIIDGFNVCSLGALLVILGLVIVLRSRKKIVLMGGTFLLTTAAIYWLLILLRHQLFTFIAPYIKSMEVLIGILAILGGVYLLREFYQAYKNGPICSSNNLMSRLVPKIQKVFEEKTNWIVLLATVMLFAIIVTIIEFPCSAFLPVLFTGILVDAGISFGMTLIYMSMYMAMYLLDEIIIFMIAVITLKIKIVSPNFIIFFNLLAACIFIGLGVYYIWGLFG